MLLGICDYRVMEELVAGVERIGCDVEADVEQQQEVQLLPFPGKDNKLRVLWHPWRAAEVPKVLGFSLLCCACCGVSAGLALGIAPLSMYPVQLCGKSWGFIPLGNGGLGTRACG